ncbi:MULTISPECIES: alpha-galactosidase [unclassified Streptomyces]|uniref:alpha-galactosidase n=1 Tax=unclassified Streptomyces TaxID=2593676 RepID=UPI0036EC0616
MSTASHEHTIEWGDDRLAVRVLVAADGRTRLAGIAPGRAPGGFDALLPLVELVTTERGHRAGERFDRTAAGLDLRYVAHRESVVDGVAVLEVDHRDPFSGLEATVRYARRPGTPVLSSSVRVRNNGASPVQLLFVSSFVLGDTTWDVASTAIRLASSEWLAESRWRRGGYAELGGPDVAMAAHAGATPRGCLAVTGRGTWSTGRSVPMGALESPDGATLLWQVESNGGWRFQVAVGPGPGPSGALELVTCGPTDPDHAWSPVLAPGDAFTTPVTTLAFSPLSFEDAVAALTAYRRADRRPYAGDDGLPVIYNDYMDTLMADPTTQRLLPLIAAVGRTGAEVFVVDAGWYSDEPGWWDLVGAWEPSTRRFPGGIDEVFHAIRAAGMDPGLWIEPDAVGVRSPVAALLPEEAFYRRNGRRVVFDGRYRLDYRHPEVVARMDAVIDRLVGTYGLRYLKFDDNVDGRTGTDEGGKSPGQGLFEASRAMLGWVEGVHRRHPSLLIEDCASGGMRADWLTMSRFALLSTSDQQDALRVVPIAAAAPLLVPPEQAGVWSCPQPGMPVELARTSLASSLLRRPILSGRYDLMAEEELALVREFVAVHKSVRAGLRTSTCLWPLGLPGWDDAWVASGLAGPREGYLVVTRRHGGPERMTIPLTGVLAALGRPAHPAVTCVFPLPDARTWELAGDALHIALGETASAAFRIRTG